MSHVVTDTMLIDDLACAAEAAEALGLELMIDQHTFKWFGQHVGDYPLPEGFTVADMGRCDHALRVKGDKGAYEIGLVRRRDGKPGFGLMYDFFAGGYGLMKRVGANASLFKQQYQVAVARKNCKKLTKLGFKMNQFTDTQGKLHLKWEKGK